MASLPSCCQLPICYRTQRKWRWRCRLLHNCFISSPPVNCLVVLYLRFLLLALGISPCRQSFYIQEKNLTQNKAASRAVLSGAIIGAVANYALIILFGTRQEKERPVET